MKEKQIFTINEMAEKTGVHPQTLRNWEKDGLIKSVEKLGNKRFFTEKNMNDILKIQELKSYGYQLKGIKKMLEKGDLKTMATANKVQKNVKKTTKPANRIKSKIPTVNYAEKSITELTDIAKLQGLKYFRQMNKGELVEALSNPKNAEVMIEQAKNRTRERYGDKVYGKNKTVIPKTVPGISIKEKDIRNILKLNKEGLSVKEIHKQMFGK